MVRRTRGYGFGDIRFDAPERNDQAQAGKRGTKIARCAAAVVVNHDQGGRVRVFPDIVRSCITGIGRICVNKLNATPAALVVLEVCNCRLPSALIPSMSCGTETEA